MSGLRKFIYSITFGFLILILIVVLKFNGKELNKWEFYTLATVFLGFPITNILGKLFQASALKEIAKIVDKVSYKSKKDKKTDENNDDNDNNINVPLLRNILKD